MEIIVLILSIIGVVNHTQEGKLDPSVAIATYTAPAPVFIPYNYNSLNGGDMHLVFSEIEQDYVISNAPQLPTSKTPYRASVSKTAERKVVSQEDLTKGEVELSPSPKLNSLKKVAAYSCDDTTFKVYFDNNKSNLDKKAVTVIRTAVTQALACENKSFSVYGHATVVGSIEHNIELATKRAKEVSSNINKITPLSVRILNPLNAEDTIKLERVAIIKLEGVAPHA